ncbi:MAG TPA: prepilin-type N-terminal cleavage/methylation domain-containing protein [Candidatus Angelobacter sp.]|nr:prepilin-type N-terminal cleavage/methylation domain-containing protein [Candidatus Angelobacter sp.]
MDQRTSIRKGRQSRSSGFSLIELTFAMSILAVGLLGGIVVIGVATANNGRSKQHTTAATLAESTLEKIVAIPKSASGAAAQTQITDCAGNNFTIETSQGGSALISTGAFAGSIDFSQPAAANYSMGYVMCAAGGNITYDVRWRVDPGPTPGTQLVTVSAKNTSGNGGQIFTLPYTLHYLRGDF